MTYDPCGWDTDPEPSAEVPDTALNLWEVWRTGQGLAGIFAPYGDGEKQTWKAVAEAAEKEFDKKRVSMSAYWESVATLFRKECVKIKEERDEAREQVDIISRDRDKEAREVIRLHDVVADLQEKLRSLKGRDLEALALKKGRHRIEADRIAALEELEAVKFDRDEVTAELAALKDAVRKYIKILDALQIVTDMEENL